MIPIAKPYFGGKELQYVSECINEGWVSSIGKFIHRFESEFANYHSVEYATTTSNGTAALHLALEALGVGPGDEVIVPNLTFIASVNAIRYVGAEPIFVDSEKETWNLDLKDVQDKITQKTKAILPVHLYGNPCNMVKLMEVAKHNSLFVVEDCAEALGAEYADRKVGSFGDISCFSFFGNKIITTGEGGMCTTNNEGLYKKMQLLKNHGMDANKKYWHPVIGFNYRMTNIQAAIGLAQMEQINNFLEKRKQIAHWYSDYLNEIKGLNLHPKSDGGKEVYWMYSIILDEGIHRNKLIEHLRMRGIDTRPFFALPTRMPPYESDTQFPNASFLSSQGLNLPTSVDLTKENICFVCNNLKEALNELLH